MNEFKESLKVTEEQRYEMYLQERRQRELEKKKWENAKISKEEQRKIIQDVRDEQRY